MLYVRRVHSAAGSGGRTAVVRDRGRAGRLIAWRSMLSLTTAGRVHGAGVCTVCRASGEGAAGRSAKRGARQRQQPGGPAATRPPPPPPPPKQQQEQPTATDIAVQAQRDRSRNAEVLERRRLAFSEDRLQESLEDPSSSRRRPAGPQPVQRHDRGAGGRAGTSAAEWAVARPRGGGSTSTSTRQRTSQYPDAKRFLTREQGDEIARRLRSPLDDTRAGRRAVRVFRRVAAAVRGPLPPLTYHGWPTPAFLPTRRTLHTSPHPCMRPRVRPSLYLAHPCTHHACRHGIDDLRLLKALELADLAGHVVVVDRLPGADVVLTARSKRLGKQVWAARCRGTRACLAARVPGLAAGAPDTLPGCLAPPDKHQEHHRTHTCLAWHDRSTWLPSGGRRQTLMCRWWCCLRCRRCKWRGPWRS
jgi:hypothetical protein